MYGKNIKLCYMDTGSFIIILLVKDIEISSKKFICDRFLFPKFREKLCDELW